jgi:hypothetical protein
MHVPYGLEYSLLTVQVVCVCVCRLDWMSKIDSPPFEFSRVQSLMNERINSTHLTQADLSLPFCFSFRPTKIFVRRCMMKWMGRLRSDSVTQALTRNHKSITHLRKIKYHIFFYSTQQTVITKRN